MVTTANIGMNLAGVNYYQTEFPFIDRMKTASSWMGADNIKLDANGYPLAIPAGVDTVYTMVGMDPLSAGLNNTYVLTYTGTATFELLGGRIISSEPGKITFEFTRTDSNLMPLKVSGLSASAPLGNMHIVHADQQALFAAGEIFNPAFLAKLSGFDTLRTMDWSGANSLTTAHWADRTTTAAMTWQNSATSAVPIEVMVALANKTKTNMWLNVPTQADDDYVRQMVKYVHDNLDPSLSVHLEYSNEVWNFGFSQSGYAARQADALWGTDANHDGKIDPNDPAEHVGTGWVNWYGYRAAQVAAIANQVYGADAGRLHNVLSTQTAWQGLETYIIDGVAKANVGTPAALFDDYAITTYFGDLDGATDADRKTILGWARGGDAGMAAAFAALRDGTGVGATGSLASMVAVYAYQAKVAAKLGLDLVAYEGGVGLVTQNFAAGDQKDVQAFFSRLDADPRMGELYRQTTADFARAGGKLENFFDDAGGDSAWGTYGALKSIYDTGTPVWNAILADQAAAKAAKAAVTAPVATPVAAPITTPAVTPATTPVATPVATPAATPITTPVTTSVATPIVAPITTVVAPVTTPVVAPVVAPVTIAVATPVATPVVTPVATPVVTPATVSVTAPATPVAAAATTPVTTPVTTSVATPVTTPVVAPVTTPALSTTVAPVPVATPTPTPVTAAPIASSAPALTAGQTDKTSYTLATGERTIAYVGHQLFTATGNDLDNVITAGDGGSVLHGGTGADTLIGGAGADLLDGGTGIDRMVGGAGDDIYIVDDYRDVVIEVRGGGTDEVRTTLGAYALGDEIEKLTYTGTGSFQGLGNALDNVLTGGSGSNRLFGGAGKDTLIGGAGADILDGGSGADRMVGGAGNDIYFVDDIGDQVIEQANGGTDIVYSSISYTLGDNVENLTLFGGGAIDGTGNALDNVIVGTSGANRLVGGAGNDTLDGGAGDDVLTGGAGVDTLTGGTGADRFVFSVGDLDADPAKSDTITDFSHDQGDRIDLSGFDANPVTKQRDAFTFLGTAAFTKHAGELRIDTSSGHQIIMGDLNGDGVADFTINLSRGIGTLITTDFVL